jgi:hypothetical protein
MEVIWKANLGMTVGRYMKKKNQDTGQKHVNYHLHNMS